MDYDVPLTPLSATFAGLAAILTLLLPRRIAIVPIFVATCYLPIGQSVQIAGLHFYLFRLMLIASFSRILIRGEITSIRWCFIDTLMCCFVTAYLGAGAFSGGWGLFITRGGTMFDWLLSYIVARSLLRDRSDFVFQIRFIGIIIIPLAALMLVEKITGKNFLSVLGGVGEMSVIRDGEVRAQGAFRHPILAGTFGATLLPLLAGLILMRNKWIVIVGSVCAGIMVWAAASSGPLLAGLSGIGGLGLWRLRHSMRLVRVGLLLIVLAIQAGMSRPVWYIFDTVSSFTGGEGWHRSYIIDASIRHWDEWWLAGTPITVHWGGQPPAPGDLSNIDITNEFVMLAVKGGALSLALFLAILWVCYKMLGHAFRARGGSVKRDTEWLAWCTGVTVFSHCVAFFSVAYFDQSIFYFLWLLSAIATGAMERGWLICDRSARSVRLASTAHKGISHIRGRPYHPRGSIKLKTIVQRRRLHWAPSSDWQPSSQ